MLVLLRRVGQSIVIDGQILVTVSKVRSNRVLLGITAPEGTPVHRKEIAIRSSAGKGRDRAKGPGPDAEGGNDASRPEGSTEP
jgi:carbon storage regulator